MIQTAHTVRRITTTDHSKVDELLNLTINELVPVALALSNGLRVTRIGPGDYIVETAADVACGYTVCEQL